MLAIALARRRVAQIPSVAALRRAYTLPPPSGLDEGERNIYTKLAERFAPTSLLVQDISGACRHSHAVFLSQIHAVQGAVGRSTR